MVHLPPGVEPPAEEYGGPGQRAMVVNETDLPDQAVMTFLEEHASVLGVNASTSFGTYANEGSLLARARFKIPANLIEEIALARDLVDRDDDLGAALGSMYAIAFEGGMQHLHRDDVTKATFDEMASEVGLDAVWPELLREWLIAGSVTTATVFTSEALSFIPQTADRQRTRSLLCPRIGVLPAEQVRVVDNDMFRTGTLAYKPQTRTEERWLERMFDPKTSEAEKRVMRREDPLLATLCVEQLEVEDEFAAASFFSVNAVTDAAAGRKLYRLNPRMVHRSSMPKGAAKYARPPMTRNFALIEAKRQLNIMDYALLQGGSNFLIVAKKGSDTRPALPEEVSGLRDTLRGATKTGLIVGDHRLDIEIITPDLSELLSPAKRNLLGRKLANAMLRVPEADEDAGGEGMKARQELVGRVISLDRHAMKRHVESGPYREAVKRNDSLTQGPAKVWFPKIVLSGTNYFTDYILKMRDRGDISRRAAVEAGGFDYDSEVEARKREKDRGDDEVMTAGDVPFSGGQGPQDIPEGRPTGSGPNNGAPGADRSRPPAATPTRVIRRTPGETVRAFIVEDEPVRMGEQTHAILEEYPEAEIGRLTKLEQRAVAFMEGNEWPGPFNEGPVHVVPVNPDHDLKEIRAVRLAPGLSILVGARHIDNAICARALCFREPEFQGLDAEERAMAWGFPTREED